MVMAKVARNPARTPARSQSSRGVVVEDAVAGDGVFITPPSKLKRWRRRASWGPNWGGLYRAYESFTNADCVSDSTKRAFWTATHRAGQAPNLGVAGHRD